MKQSTEQWEKTLKAIEKSLNARDYSIWIDNRLSFVQYDKQGGIIHLRVDSDLTKANIQAKFAKKIGPSFIFDLMSNL